MGRYFNRVLTFLVIACCLVLQPAEATDNKDADFGFGYMFTSLSNRELISANGLSWKTPLSESFSIQNVLWLLEDEKTSVAVTNRFLYTVKIHSRSQLYWGWGTVYPRQWQYETLIGFEYFFLENADFGYTIEFGLSRLKRAAEDSEDGSRLGKRLLFGYHLYF